MFGDRFGKKWFLVAGGLFGIAGNILAGTASNVNSIIGGQALNGIAASLLVCTSALRATDRITYSLPAIGYPGEYGDCYGKNTSVRARRHSYFKWIDGYHWAC